MNERREEQEDEEEEMDAKSEEIKTMEHQMNELERKIGLYKEMMETQQEMIESMERNSETLKEMLRMAAKQLLLVSVTAEQSIKSADQMLQTIQNCEDKSDMISSIQLAVNQNREMWEKRELDDMKKIAFVCMHLGHPAGNSDRSDENAGLEEKAVSLNSRPDSAEEAVFADSQSEE